MIITQHPWLEHSELEGTGTEEANVHIYTFSSSDTKLHADSKGPGLAVDLEATEKEELKGNDSVFSKNLESGRVTTLAHPRTLVCRYEERFQVLEDFLLMILTVFLLYLAH